jgi:hypothetical protein
MTSLSSNRDLVSEIKNFDHCWHQGATAFQEGRIYAKKIFTLLKIQYSSSFSTKHIVEKMIGHLGHLNGISYGKIRNLLRDDVLIE